MSRFLPCCRAAPVACLVFWPCVAACLVVLFACAPFSVLWFRPPASSPPPPALWFFFGFSCFCLLFVPFGGAGGGVRLLPRAFVARPAWLCAVLFLLVACVSLLWCALWWCWCCPPPPRPRPFISWFVVFIVSAAPFFCVFLFLAVPCSRLWTWSAVWCVCCRAVPCWGAVRCGGSLCGLVACCPEVLLAALFFPFFGSVQSLRALLFGAILRLVAVPCVTCCAAPGGSCAPAVGCIPGLCPVVLSLCCLVLSRVVVQSGVLVWAVLVLWCLVLWRSSLWFFVLMFFCCSLPCLLSWRGLPGCGAVVPCGAPWGLLCCLSLCCVWWRVLCGAVVCCADVPVSCRPVLCFAVFWSMVGAWSNCCSFPALLCWSGLFLSVSAARCGLPVACVVAGVPVWLCGPLPSCVLWFVVIPWSPVLCPVVPCVCVVPCCGAVLSFLFRWRCLFVLAAFSFLSKQENA